MFLLLLALSQPPAPPPAGIGPYPDEAKPAKPAPPPAATKPAPEFEVQFTDGGNIRVVILEPAVTVSTKFGKLDIPFAELKKVDFGFRYPAGVEAKVGEAVGKLGAPAFRDREDAERELMSQKEYALAAVRRAAKSGDPEVVRRAEPLLKKLLAVVPEDRQQARDHDIIETTDFTVKGRLELAGLKVKTKQFGEATLRVDEVKAFRTLAGVGPGNELTLDAGRFARPGWTSWMDTGIDVVADKSLDVSCTGTIDQWPQEPGKYISGPAGTAQQAPGFPQPMNNIPGMGMPGRMMQPFMSGAVVGRIGPAGMAFPVGAAMRQPRPGVSGRLFLCVAPSNWNNDSTGSYKVTVKVGE